jgi:hypothetical protein
VRNWQANIGWHRASECATQSSVTPEFPPLPMEDLRDSRSLDWGEGRGEGPSSPPSPRPSPPLWRFPENSNAARGRGRKSVAPCLRVSVVSLLASVGMFLLICAGLRAEESASEEPPLTQADRDYWAYQPVVRPTVPEVAGDGWSRNSIDKFVLAKLHAQGLQPVEAAERMTLLRRVTFDLTGLPPTIEEQQEFAAAEEFDTAWQRVLDRLLTSRAYGERWAQHWLDLVRFAETDGFEHDHVRPEAWRYRDWVVQALNTNLPYDQFLTFQLAGDEIAPDSPDAQLATGYLLAGPDMPDLNSQEERRHIYLNAMTANVGEVVLGLHLGCAECHHHKVDPISQHDFYRLRAFFETIELFPEKPKSEVNDTDAPAEKPRRKFPKERVVWNREGETPASHVWIRGDFRRPGPEITAAFPRVLTSTVSPESREPNRRTQLAAWLTSRQNPLTARVMVNRVWQHHFGVGLRPTPSDFGWMGEEVTHPELLDWLAAEFMESGWDLRELHRLILSSATYQLASVPKTSEGMAAWKNLREVDPANHCLGRMNRQRLEGEVIRDSLLAMSGELSRKAGGPGVRPPLPPEVASTLLRDQWPVTEDAEEHTRRSIYLFSRRNLRLPLLEVFDKPDTNLSCARRTQSTIAPQALHLLNSEFVRERARQLAARVEAAATDPDQRVAFLYQIVLARQPTHEETAAAKEFLSSSETETGWVDLCHAMLNLNEFLYMD